MISWMHIIDIGHTAVMMPAAGAIAAWLIVGKAWKAAMSWCLILALGLGLVAWSKIAFLGWGLEIQSIGFQALSGHAWRATTVIPVFFFVMLHRTPRAWRIGGALAGAAFALGLGTLLVIFDFHTVSEVLASTVLGLTAAYAFIRIDMTCPASRTSPWAAPVTALTFIAICGLEPSALNRRLVDVALYVSGRDEAYPWLKNGDPRLRERVDRRSLQTCHMRVPH